MPANTNSVANSAGVTPWGLPIKSEFDRPFDHSRFHQQVPNTPEGPPNRATQRAVTLNNQMLLGGKSALGGSA